MSKRSYCLRMARTGSVAWLDCYIVANWLIELSGNIIVDDLFNENAQRGAANGSGLYSLEQKLGGIVGLTLFGRGRHKSICFPLCSRFGKGLRQTCNSRLHHS